MNSYIKIQWCWKISVVCRHEVKLLQTLKRHFYKLDYIKGTMILDSYCWKRYQWKGNWWQSINLLICKTTIWHYISPFLFSEIVEHHLDETNTATAKQIKDNIYVDNVITSPNNDDKALQLYKKAKKIYQALMNLHGWTSNSKIVNGNTSPDDQMKERVTKVYGPIWNTNTSLLYLKKTASITKSLHQGHGLCYLHLPFFCFICTVLCYWKMKSYCDCCFPQQIRSLFNDIYYETITVWVLVSVWLTNATHCL